MRIRSGLARRFLRAREGNVAMLFALSMPVLMMVGLGAVDVNRVYTVRSHLQDALDAATLAAARSNFTDNQRINEAGMAALMANLRDMRQIQRNENGDPAVVGSFALNNQGIVVGTATVRANTLIANIVLPPYGKVMDDQIPVGSRSEVFRSNNRIEVAMVLDNTGSMAGAKLTNTKTAAKNLIDRLAAADARSVEVDAVKISLVPFSMTVRPVSTMTYADGVNNAKRPAWLSNATNHAGSDMFSTGVGRFTLFNQMRADWYGCVESRPYPYDVTDEGSDPTRQATMFTPYLNPDEPDADDYRNDQAWQNYFGWSGNNYLDDGVAGNTRNNGGFSNSTQRAAMWKTRRIRVEKYNKVLNGHHEDFGPNRGCALEPVQRLSRNFNGLKQAVDRMVATGNTNVPMGLMWGWHTLSPNMPFRDGRTYGSERLQKIIILMTDGENVNSESSNPDNSDYSGVGLIWQGRLSKPNPNGYTVGLNSSGYDRRVAMDNRLAELCGNIRQRNIIVYSVGVQVDNRTQELLRNCATEPENYFNVTSAGDIGAAFDRIAGAIENLRIAK